MQHAEQYLRAESIAYLHDIQGWVVGEQIRQLMREVKTIQQQENIISALERIYQHMRDASNVLQRTSQTHHTIFTRQMHNIGAYNLVASEPYLESIIAQYRLEYLQTLEKLFARVNGLLDTKSIDPTAPIMAEVERELATIEARAVDRLTHGLDEARQRSNGVRRYIWRTADDDRVRASHAARDDQLFDWDDDGIKPGEEFGCRCFAEPVANENGEYQVAVAPLAIPFYYLVLSDAIVIGAAAVVASRNAQQIGLLNEEAESGEKPTSTDKPTNTPSGNQDPDKDPNDPFKRPQGVPEHWEEKPSKRGEGKKWVDPNNEHTDVRVQKGNPDSSNSAQQEDYVKWKKEGKWLDKDANVVRGESPEAHIPKEDFKFDPRIFK